MKTQRLPSGPFLVSTITGCTRWLQDRRPGRPLKGLTRFSNLMNRWVPAYDTVVQFRDGVRMHVDTHHPAERWLLYSGDYQPAVTHALHAHTPPGGYCLDVGANVGFYTVKLARWVGPSGRVAAFEANPIMVERVEQNVALNHFPHVSVVHAAVCDRSGTVDFHIARNAGKSSLVRTPGAVQTTSVRALTIDEYLAGCDWPRLDAVKLDVEGADCQALLGAAGTLARARPFVVFEYRPAASDVAQEAIRLLTELGYELWALSSTGRRRRFDPQGAYGSDVVCIPTNGRR